MLAGRRYPVVTGSTGAQDLRVVDNDRGFKDARAVTVFAHVGRLDVRQAFSGGGRTVVAADTIADDAGVIEQCREPGARVVAVVTLIIGGDMVRRLTGCLDAVVAGVTAAGNRRVVHKGDDRPTGGQVAIRAFARGRDMVGWFRR